MLGTRKDENIKAYRLFVIDRYLNDAIKKNICRQNNKNVCIMNHTLHLNDNKIVITHKIIYVYTIVSL